MGYPQQTVVVYTDSQVAMAWCTPRRALSKKNKHLDRQTWYCKEKVAEKLITLRHIPSAQQQADLLTKNLPRATHEKLSAMLLNVTMAPTPEKPTIDATRALVSSTSPLPHHDRTVSSKL